MSVRRCWAPVRGALSSLQFLLQICTDLAILIFNSPPPPTQNLLRSQNSFVLNPSAATHWIILCLYTDDSWRTGSYWYFARDILWTHRGFWDTVWLAFEFYIDRRLSDDYLHFFYADRCQQVIISTSSPCTEVQKFFFLGISLFYFGFTLR